jgi:hypothetical protein
MGAEQGGEKQVSQEEKGGRLETGELESDFRMALIPSLLVVLVLRPNYRTHEVVMALVK